MPVCINENNRTNSFQKSKIKIAHLNIRSLKNRDHLIQMRQLAHENDYDIIAISESWLNSTVTNAEVEIAGYKLSRVDRLSKPGGGVCAYTRSSLKTKVLKHLSGISTLGFHQLWMQVQHNKLKSILLCVTYRPPDCSTTCFEDFVDKYSQALTYGKGIFVVGDLNCNMMKSVPDADALKDLCSSLNLTQLITSPTRVTSQSSSLIDVIMTSKPDFVTESGVVETHISDHYMVYSVLKLKLPKPPPVYVTARNYKRYDPELFTKELAQVPWHEISMVDDVNTKLDCFNHHFLQVLNRHAPVKAMKIRYRQCSFINQEIKDLMNTRDGLHKLARQTGMLVDWGKYRFSRDQVKKSLRNAEKEYLQNEIHNNQNRNSMWKAIRKCIPRKEVSQPVYTRDVKILANEFNDFFTSMGARAAEAAKKLAMENDLPLQTNTTTVTPQIHLDEFQFRPVSSTEIRKIIDSFPSNKAPGPDKVSMKVIKDALPYILLTLTEIVNCSLLTSVFPTAWKDAEVVPLLKEGDCEIADNNRPISLLPAASKLCERVALNQLTEYMVRQKRLSQHQSGNKKQYSTETLNVFMSDMILNAIDKKEVIALVLLDLSKAFDSIKHSLLLEKLRVLGLSKESIDWFRSYLSNRCQSVRLGSQLSETRVTTHGVPQGSILGPALFGIYINDLPSIPDMCSLESYVDDSKLYLSFPVKDADGAKALLTADLRKIATWCCANSLLINPNKTKLLILGSRQMVGRIPDDFHVSLLGKDISPVPFAKDLGIILDSSLTYDEHITQVVSKCMGSLCQINRVKHVLDQKTLIIVINALVFSRMFYCSCVWANTSKKNIAKLQNVQNFAARIITNTKKYDHITPVLEQLKWLPVCDMLRLRDAVLTFKCIKGLAPPYLCDRLITRMRVHNRDTRNNNELDIPLCRSAAGQRSFLYRAVALWNQLPVNIQNKEHVDNFKTVFKRFLLEQFVCK